MPSQLSDSDITVLLAEPKPLPGDYQSKLQLRLKSGHKERELELLGPTVRTFSSLFARVFSILSTFP